MPSADQVPIKLSHLTMRWHEWFFLIAGSTGSALRCCLGTGPIQAEKLRPDRKAFGSEGIRLARPNQLLGLMARFFVHGHDPPRASVGSRSFCARANQVMRTCPTKQTQFFSKNPTRVNSIPDPVEPTFPNATDGPRHVCGLRPVQKSRRYQRERRRYLLMPRSGG